MERYSIHFIFPPNSWLQTLVLFVSGICLLFAGVKFFSNVKSGATLLYLGHQQIMMWKILPGLVKREDANKKFNVYGYAYISPTKCVIYGSFFCFAALFMILLNFVSIMDLGK